MNDKTIVSNNVISTNVIPINQERKITNVIPINQERKITNVIPINQERKITNVIPINQERKITNVKNDSVISKSSHNNIITNNTKPWPKSTILIASDSMMNQIDGST